MDKNQRRRFQTLMMHIIDETNRYNDAVENGKEFSEAKEIKNGIQTLKNELRELLSNESNKYKFQ